MPLLAKILPEQIVVFWKCPICNDECFADLTEVEIFGIPICTDCDEQMTIKFCDILGTTEVLE